jgi:hypothetical protein
MELTAQGKLDPIILLEMKGHAVPEWVKTAIYYGQEERHSEPVEIKPQ